MATYILNNGPKEKGGRFLEGTHQSIKKMFPHITFTSKPEKANFVIVPDGIDRPGSKIIKRNPILGDSANILTISAFMARASTGSVFKQSSGYSVSKEPKEQYSVSKEPREQYSKKSSKSHRKKKSEMYTDDKSILSKVDKVSKFNIDMPYPVMRQKVRGQVSDSYQIQLQPQQPAPSMISSKISELDRLLGVLPENPVVVLEEAQKEITQLAPPTPNPAPMSMLPMISSTSIPPSPHQSIRELLDAIKKSYQYIQGSEVYKVENVNDVFNDGTLDHSMSIVQFARNLELVRVDLNMILYEMNQRKPIPDLEQIRDVARRQANISDMAWGFVKEKLATTLETFFKLDLTDKSLIFQDQTLVMMCVELVEYLYVFITQFLHRNREYRARLESDARRSNLALECKDQNLLCQDVQEPEPLAKTLYMLYNISCEMIQMPSDEYKTKVEFKELCSKNEQMHYNVCTVYNAFYLNGIKNTNTGLLGPVSGQLCNDLYDSVFDTVSEMEEFKESKQTIVQVLRKLQSFQTSSDSIFKTTMGKSMYANFHLFLTSLIVDTKSELGQNGARIRPEVMTNIQKSFSVLNQQERTEYYTCMLAVSLFFLMANFCSGSGDGWIRKGQGVGEFSAEKIERLLKTDYRIL